MKVIFIRHYKLKAVIGCNILILGVLTLLFSHYILNNNLSFKITIDNYLSFSYPVSFKINNILVNKNLDEKSAKVNHPFEKPLTRSFTNFGEMAGIYSYNYPASFDMSQKAFPESYLLYHIDFQRTPQNASYFIQVWNLPYSLSEFLSNSELPAKKVYKDYSLMPVEINEVKGYSRDYITLWKNKEYYKVKEVFLKKDDRMYRISYFIPENMWEQSQGKIYWGMVKSVSIY